MWKCKSWYTGAVSFLILAALTAVGLNGGRMQAQEPSDSAESTAPLTPEAPAETPRPLKTMAVPSPINLVIYIKDMKAAAQLGKAFFWDMQTGGDGRTACATCHYHAGTDARTKNTVNPGLRGGDETFDFGPNHVLTVNDFPFHRLSDVDDARSTVEFDTNDVVGSQGVIRGTFAGITLGSFVDQFFLEPDSIFQVGGINTRQVTARNTPTVIGAVFNFRNFWDGRAQWDFNGATPFGSRDPDAHVFRCVANTIKPLRIRLENSSLASQAVGPPNNFVEMSFEGRSFPLLARKLLSLTPLGTQLVHRDDSLLGLLANSRTAPGKPGLKTTYAALIKQAFRAEWCDCNKILVFDEDGNFVVKPMPARKLNDNEFTLMEANFSLFWGLAIQCYESTLVPDQTPYDKFAGGDASALTEQQKTGFRIFVGAGCATCHNGPNFTNADSEHVRYQRLRRMRMGDNKVGVYDTGYYNIGVRPTHEDFGLGDEDPFGNPLSDTEMAQLGRTFVFSSTSPQNIDVDPDERAAVMGNFKVPTLRNVELTGPYFHNGGQATLMQVVEFYNRGGDFAKQNRRDLDAGIQPLGLTPNQKKALVAFLKSLTDARVKFERAPFDHPQLFIPNGHKGDETAVQDDDGLAKDDLKEIPACGASGSPGIQPVFPQN